MKIEMTKIDPIIAVKNVDESSKWYESLFGFSRTHGGSDFAVLRSENHEIVLCLHKWGEHGHPSMTNQEGAAGNGLILYFRTDKINAIRQNAEKKGAAVEEEIHLNPNSQKLEFSLKDPNGYYLTISEYHEYEG